MPHHCFIQTKRLNYHGNHQKTTTKIQHPSQATTATYGQRLGISSQEATDAQDLTVEQAWKHNHRTLEG